MSRRSYRAGPTRGRGGNVVTGMPALRVAYTPDPPRPERRLSAAALRHRAMVEDRLAGMSWREIGLRHGVAHPESVLRTSHYVLTEVPLATYRKLGL